MQLLYGRSISIHMAYEIRDALLVLISTNANVSNKTKEWFMRTFGSDDSMKVSVHPPIRVRLKHSADEHTSISQFLDDLRVLCGLID